MISDCYALSELLTGAMPSDPLLAVSMQQAKTVACAIDGCHVEYCNALTRQKQVQAPLRALLLSIHSLRLACMHLPNTSAGLHALRRKQFPGGKEGSLPAPVSDLIADHRKGPYRQKHGFIVVISAKLMSIHCQGR